MSRTIVGAVLLVAVVILIMTSGSSPYRLFGVSCLALGVILEYAASRCDEPKGGGNPLLVNIHQNGTVMNMKLDCDMNSSGNKIDCSTDAPLLYQPETLSSTLIHAPFVGTAYKMGKHAMKMGEEYVDRVTGKPYGTTANTISDSATGLSNKIKEYSVPNMFKTNDNSSSRAASWLFGD